MSRSTGENGSRPRLSLGVKLAIVFVALAVLPLAGVSYYVISQAQAEESLLQPGTAVLIGVAVTGVAILVAATMAVIKLAAMAWFRLKD